MIRTAKLIWIKTSPPHTRTVGLQNHPYTACTNYFSCFTSFNYSSVFAVELAKDFSY